MKEIYQQKHQDGDFAVQRVDFSCISHFKT